MMGMFKCKEFDGDESTALNEISEDLGLAYQMGKTILRI